MNVPCLIPATPPSVYCLAQQTHAPNTYTHTQGLPLRPAKHLNPFAFHSFILFPEVNTSRVAPPSRVASHPFGSTDRRVDTKRPVSSRASRTGESEFSTSKDRRRCHLRASDVAATIECLRECMDPPGFPKPPSSTSVRAN